MGGINRLHAHSVTDKTALSSYVPAARRWLAWCQTFNAPLNGGAEALDRALADYLAYLCYTENKDISEGRSALWGATCVFLELLDHTPLAQRALKGWERLSVTAEGGPIPWAGIAALINWFRQHGGPEAAAVTLLATDCYLRLGEWDMLQVRDVVDGASGMALLIGNPERGQSAKTGTRQGVRPDYSETEALLRERCRGRPPTARLFQISPEQYRRAWHAACHALSWWPGPPHSLRHSGPSYDAYCNYRNLDLIRVRGRWRAKTSVLRYQKTHTLLAAEAGLPPGIRKLGSNFEEVRGVRSATPRQ